MQCLSAYGYFNFTRIVEQYKNEKNTLVMIAKYIVRRNTAIFKYFIT